MKRSAVWPWRRIAFISFLVAVGWIALDVALGLNVWWSFAGGAFIWFSAYSTGRAEQTEAFGIRMIEFIKNHHEGNEEQPWT